MAEPKTLAALDVAKLNIFSDNEGGDVDLALSVVQWTTGSDHQRTPILRVELTAACAWFGFDLDLEEADTFAEQMRLGALALRGAIAARREAKARPAEDPPRAPPSTTIEEG